MDKFDLNKLFKVPTEINTKNLNPHRYPLFRVDFATSPAQPSIIFGDTQSKTVICVSAAPIMFLDPIIPNGLNYTVQVMSENLLDGEELGIMVACVLETFPMRYLSAANQDESNRFRMAIDKVPHVDIGEAGDGDTYTYMIVATIEVDEETIEDNLKLLHNQLNAYQLLQKGTRNESV